MSSVALLLDEQTLRQLVMEAVTAALAENASQPRFPEHITIKQAAEITGYSVNSLYQMNSKGQVPGAIKLGGKLLFETETLREWVRSGATPKNG